jgi:hypothetical protein
MQSFRKAVLRISHPAKAQRTPVHTRPSNSLSNGVDSMWLIPGHYKPAARGFLRKSHPESAALSRSTKHHKARIFRNQRRAFELGHSGTSAGLTE